MNCYFLIWLFEEPERRVRSAYVWASADTPGLAHFAKRRGHPALPSIEKGNIPEGHVTPQCKHAH